MALHATWPVVPFMRGHKMSGMCPSRGGRHGPALRHGLLCPSCVDLCASCALHASCACEVSRYEVGSADNWLRACVLHACVLHACELLGAFRGAERAGGRGMVSHPRPGQVAQAGQVAVATHLIVVLCIVWQWHGNPSYSGFPLSPSLPVTMARWSSRFVFGVCPVSCKQASIQPPGVLV